ncbi:reverse transcriptase domain-containing protein [Tanacetum coccineum]|uniref:Reverse transcriptase domain-containing protein n=1 Tax=Tanacetum coccineum TaxID=301880 RepID=A0ABQ5GFZ0_9ASTR
MVSDGKGTTLFPMIVPYGELNGVSIALMASFGVISKSADKIFVFHGAVDIKIKDLAIFVDSQLVANQVKGLFEARQPVIKQYLEKTKEVLGSFDSYTMEHVQRDQNKKDDALSNIASMTFTHLAKEVLIEVLAGRSIVQREVADIIKEEGENWMLPIREYLLFGLLPKDQQRARNLRVKVKDLNNL